MVATACSFSREDDCFQNHERIGVFPAVYILSHSQTIYLSAEFAPGKSHILGKGSVHRSDSGFILSLWFPI